MQKESFKKLFWVLVISATIIATIISYFLAKMAGLGSSLSLGRGLIMFFVPILIAVSIVVVSAKVLELFFVDKE